MGSYNNAPKAGYRASEEERKRKGMELGKKNSYYSGGKKSSGTSKRTTKGGPPSPSKPTKNSNNTSFGSRKSRNTARQEALTVAKKGGGVRAKDLRLEPKATKQTAPKSSKPNYSASNDTRMRTEQPVRSKRSKPATMSAAPSTAPKSSKPATMSAAPSTAVKKQYGSQKEMMADFRKNNPKKSPKAAQVINKAIRNSQKMANKMVGAGINKVFGSPKNKRGG